MKAINPEGQRVEDAKKRLKSQQCIVVQRDREVDFELTCPQMEPRKRLEY